jgi:ABC-type transport system involved in multi-copper enzyme maturation permease subunit
MSATAPVSQLSFADTRPVSMGTLVKVEMRKMYDTRAGKWLLGITAGLVVVANIIALIVFTTQDVDDIQYGTFIAITSYVSGIFLPILGIMLVTQEWGQRTGMVTFTLEPHRERVILAKGLAGLLLSLGCIVLGLAIGLVMNLLYGAIHGPIGWDLGLKYMGGFALTQAIAMLAGFALAALFLNTAAAIVLFFVYTFVLPGVFAIVGGLVGWFGDLRPWIDFQAAQTPLGNANMNGDDWGHLLTAGLLWLVLPLVVGIWRILRAEVK